QDPQALEAEKIRRRKQALVWGGFVILVLLAFIFIPKIMGGDGTETAEVVACEVPPYREEEAASLIADGAAIAYNRTAGPQCVDELFAIYPDGRIIGNDGVNKVEKQLPPVDVELLLATISEDYGWFTDDIYSTYHNPCRQCFTHYIIASYDGQQKAVTAVDGGTDMPPGYGLTLAIIRSSLPEINPAQ
ncbi:MAG: hypothetical protein WBB55_00300, partial [Anaerolineales bacterium]